jgi:hypothetical protein
MVASNDKVAVINEAVCISA